VRPTAAALLLAGVSAGALLAHRLPVLGALVVLLLLVCLRAGRRAKPYLWGTVSSAGFVFLLSPFLQSTGYHELWTGPHVPVLGTLDVTTEELQLAGLNALRLACNQATNREPVLELDESEVRAAAQHLGTLGWARLATGPGSRTAKYRQMFGEALDLLPSEVSILGVLMRARATDGRRTEDAHRAPVPLRIERGRHANADPARREGVGAPPPEAARPARGAVDTPARRGAS